MEYALLLALVFLAALTAVSAVGVSLSGLYDAIQTEIAGALGG